MSRESISPKLRFEVLKRDGFTCQYCGRSSPEVELHVDHVVPVAAGGGNDPGNLTSACVECNLGKSDRPLADVVNAVGQAKSRDEWVERVVLYVRSRFAGARPGPVRDALQEALCWGCSADRVLFITADANSWVDWLRRIYLWVGGVMERGMAEDALKERLARWEKVASDAVSQATAPAEPAPEPSTEVN